MAARAMRVIWTLVVVAVVAAAGRFLYLNAGEYIFRFSLNEERPAMAPIQPPIPWHEVDAELVATFHEAHKNAEAFATSHLVLWEADLERRIDDDFLEWYFSYLNQQWLGLKAAGYWAAGQVLDDRIPVEKQLSSDIQEEFEKRVLHPEIAQLRIERIARSTVTRYIADLREHIQTIPKKYRIPQADWDRYLSEIAAMTQRSEGNRAIPISLKTVATATTVGGAVGAARLSSTLKPAMARIGSKISIRTVALGSDAAIAQLASKSGAKVGARVGGKFLGPVIGAGILAWDMWDHHATREVELPLLRYALLEYLAEFRERLLRDPEAGIFTIVDDLERSMVGSLRPA